MLGSRFPAHYGRADPPGHLQEQQGVAAHQEEPQEPVLDRGLSGQSERLPVVSSVADPDPGMRIRNFFPRIRIRLS